MSPSCTFFPLTVLPMIVGDGLIGIDRHEFDLADILGPGLQFGKRRVPGRQARPSSDADRDFHRAGRVGFKSTTFPSTGGRDLEWGRAYVMLSTEIPFMRQEGDGPAIEVRRSLAFCSAVAFSRWRTRIWSVSSMFWALNWFAWVWALDWVSLQDVDLALATRWPRRARPWRSAGRSRVGALALVISSSASLTSASRGRRGGSPARRAGLSCARPWPLSTGHRPR